MASLTPLSKGLIGLVVLGGMASAVWHLYLKERIGTAADQTPSAVSVPVQQDAPAATGAPAAAVSPAPAPLVQTPPATQQATAKSGQTQGLSADENFEAGRKLIASGDFTRARPHLEQALEQGNAGAACLLGDMTLKGQGGIAANQDKAAKLYQLAQSRNTICFAAGQ